MGAVILTFDVLTETVGAELDVVDGIVEVEAGTDVPVPPDR